GVPSPGRRGGEPALRLDGARADQRLPMVLSGLHGERGRQENELGAGAAQGQEQLGEAYVVADGEPEFFPVGLAGDDLIAGAIDVALAVAGAVGGDDVEQVDFAIAPDFAPVR